MYAYITYYPTLTHPNLKVWPFRVYTLESLMMLIAAGSVRVGPGAVQAIHGLTYGDFAS